MKNVAELEVAQLIFPVEMSTFFQFLRSAKFTYRMYGTLEKLTECYVGKQHPSNLVKTLIFYLVF